MEGRIDIDGVGTLFFGNRAKFIFTKRCQEQVEAEGANPDNIDPVKAFANLVYAGMCNWADVCDLKNPTYQDAYITADNIISMGNEAQGLVYKAFAESKAGRDVLALLPKTGEKKSEPIKPTGRKSSATRTGS